MTKQTFKKPRQIVDKYQALRIWLCITAFIAIVCVIVGSCLLNTVVEGQYYYTAVDVANYVYTFGELPDNYLTKSQIKNNNEADKYKKYSVGGDRFYNREGQLDVPQGTVLYECDIYTGNANAGHRGAERMVFFGDASKVYYTSDHYASFSLVSQWDINGVSYVCFAVATACGVFHLVVIVYAVARKNKKMLGQYLLSWQVLAVSVVLIALSPIGAILWIGNRIGIVRHEKRRRQGQ